MSAGTAGTARSLVLRQTGAVLVPAAVWIFCVLAVADAVVEGSAGYALRITVLMTAIAFAVWLVLASPCLVVERDGLRIVNPLRVHRIPFAALDAVRVGGMTMVTARHASGRSRSITSWNAPGVPRRYTPSTAPVASVIESFRTSWESSAGPEGGAAVVATSWRWRPALVLLALVATNISIWLR
jgi:hypothetical protein